MSFSYFLSRLAFLFEVLRAPTGRQSKHPPHTQVGCRRQAERAGKLRGMEMLNRNLAEQKRHDCTKLNRNARNRTLRVTTRNRQRNRNDKLQRDHSRWHSQNHYQRIQQPINKPPGKFGLPPGTNSARAKAPPLTFVITTRTCVKAEWSQRVPGTLTPRSSRIHDDGVNDDASLLSGTPGREYV